MEEEIRDVTGENPTATDLDAEAPTNELDEVLGQLEEEDAQTAADVTADESDFPPPPPADEIPTSVNDPQELEPDSQTTPVDAADVNDAPEAIVDSETAIADSVNAETEPDEMDGAPKEEDVSQQQEESTEIVEAEPEQPPNGDVVEDSRPELDEPVNGDVKTTGDSTPPPGYDENDLMEKSPIYQNTVVAGAEADEIVELDTEPSPGANGDLDPIIMMFSNEEKNRSKSRIICFTMLFILIAITIIGVVFYAVLYYENQGSEEASSSVPPMTTRSTPP